MYVGAERINKFVWRRRALYDLCAYSGINVISRPKQRIKWWRSMKQKVSAAAAAKQQQRGTVA